MFYSCSPVYQHRRDGEFVSLRQTASERELTGGTIKALAGVPLDYSLYLVRGAESVAITGDEMVHLNDKEHFRAIPAATFGRPACYHRG